MAGLKSTDYLLHVIYLPRVFAYLFAAILTLSQFFHSDRLFNTFVDNLNPTDLEHFSWLFSSEHLMVALICLIYPHLMHWVFKSWFNYPEAVRCSMLLDAVLVGLLIATNGFHLFPATFFLSALCLSTLIIAPPIFMLGNCIILGSVCLLAFITGAPEQETISWTSSVLCTIAIISYTAFVATQGFKISAALGHGRRAYRDHSEELQSFGQRLKRYLSPQVYKALQQISGRESVTTRKRLTVFFSDIEGFTALMDNLEEELVTQMLNEYLDTMTKIAVRYGGTIDKFMGDGIMIFFGDPESLGSREDALACVRMAIAMRRELKLIRKKWRNNGISSDLHIRIGINTGHCTVGNFGAESRMDYTAIGSTVNLASRLESGATQDNIIIADNTFALVSNEIDCLELGPAKIKGVRRAVKRFQVLGENLALADRVLETEQSGMLLCIDPSQVKAKEALLVLDEAREFLLGIEAKSYKNHSASAHD